MGILGDIKLQKFPTTSPKIAFSFSLVFCRKSMHKFLAYKIHVIPKNFWEYIKYFISHKIFPSFYHTLVALKKGFHSNNQNSLIFNPISKTLERDQTSEVQQTSHKTRYACGRLASVLSVKIEFPIPLEWDR